MIDFLRVFSSKAKIIILRTLYYQYDVVPLRYIAYVSMLPLFSVERALVQLEKDKIVKRRKTKAFVFFELNKESGYYTFLRELFFIEMKNRLEVQAEHFTSKAKQVLSFAHSATHFFRKVKNKK
jgi:hypothetical protein